jgi:hypothetical protein
MSYEILYDKQFIKLDDNKFVPMIYAGSNNCYESTYNGRDRRSRSWFNFGFPMEHKKPYASLEEFMEHCKTYRQGIIDRNIETNKRNNDNDQSSWNDTYSDATFGYYSSLAVGGSTTRTTTYGSYKGIFTTGCRKALTIEELSSEGISVSISSYGANQDGLEDFYETPKNADEFISMYNEAKERFKGTKISVSINLHGASENTMKWLRKKRFPRVRKAKKLIEVDSFYTILARNGSYLVKKLKYGYKYTYYPYLKYRTEKEAERRAKRSGGVVKKINEKTKLTVNI